MCIPFLLGIALLGQTFNLNVLRIAIHISDKKLLSRKNKRHLTSNKKKLETQKRNGLNRDSTKEDK